MGSPRTLRFACLGAAGAALALATSALTLTAAPTTGMDLVGLTNGNALVRFRSDSPDTVSTAVAITGLVGGEDIVAIDVRPSTGVLYGLSSQNRLYAIGRTSGAATLIGSGPFAPAIEGTEFGFDFDPVSDRIRVVSDADRNFRLDPVTGTVVDADAATIGTQRDADLAFAAADPNASASPSVVGLAYDRSFPVTPATTLFGIDSGIDALVRVGGADGSPSPNLGQLTTIGPLGVDTTVLVGFEIAADDTAIAGLLDAGGLSRLHSVNLSTGATTLLGGIGSNLLLRGLCVAPTADLGAQGGGAFNVTKLDIKIGFRAPIGRDAITLAGTLPAPSGSLIGKVVVVDVGGVTKTFTLDAKGRAISGDDRFRLVGRARNGVNKYRVTIKREDIVALLADEGLTAEVALRRVDREVVVAVTFDGVVRQQTVEVLWTAKVGRSGSARRRPGS